MDSQPPEFSLRKARELFFRAQQIEGLEQHQIESKADLEAGAILLIKHPHSPPTLPSLVDIRNNQLVPA